MVPTAASNVILIAMVLNVTLKLATVPVKMVSISLKSIPVVQKVHINYHNSYKQLKSIQMSNADHPGVSIGSPDTQSNSNDGTSVVIPVAVVTGVVTVFLFITVLVCCIKRHRKQKLGIHKW
jgi:hypothetical protein